MSLVNYCFAKQHGGEFVLRIEDTDRVRSTRESEQAILDCLHWLGLSWDEGPDVGGPHGPYRQSERTAIYSEHADRLLKAGHAFLCFCTGERLEEMRQAQRAAKQPPRYDGRCLQQTKEQIDAELAAGTTHVVRLKVPDDGVCVVNDLRRGPIEFEWSAVDMQVLVKSDGMPTYHLANVVDDHLMQITHVIRGEEWVSSAPKHVLLYQYFGWEVPVLMHLPLLRNPDKSKLSKRKNPTSIQFYNRMGYLPEAVINFLGLLTVHSIEADEKFDLTELIERFDLEHIALAGPVFDVPKLDWLNARYLRESLDSAQFAARVQDWGFDSARLARIAQLAQPRIERLSDLGPLTAFFFAGRLNVVPDDFRGGKLDDGTIRKVLALTMWGLDTLVSWEIPAIEALLKSVAEAVEKKFREIVRPMYVAITGSPTSVPLYDSMELLGRDICRERLRYALEQFGGVNAAEQKAWKK